MNSSLSKDKRTYLKNKTSVRILIIAAICFSILGILLYRTISNSLMQKRKSVAMDIVFVVSQEIDGDAFDTISSEDDPEYQKLFKILSKYQQASYVDYIYTMKPANGEAVFVVDADPDEESRAHFGEEYILTESMRPAFEGKICCDKEVTKDRWGNLISAYAPIIKSDGKVVGLVGVDNKIEGINRERSILAIQIFLLIAGFFTVCAIFLFNFWSSFTKRDMLTGIMNYDSLVEKGEALRKKGTLDAYSIIQLNIRNFKFINSKIGTSLGDILLIQYAGIISGSLNSDEYCARTGSDNFILLVKKGREDDLIEKLSETWINLSAYGINDLIQISIRCGIYEIHKNDTVQDSINYTSVALKQARVSNQNFIIRFEKDMLDSMVESTKIITDFRRALDEEEFQVYYQPKVNIKTNDLCGAEALIRWKKDGKIVSPGEFIPVLENEGLVTELDFFVFETVCQHICEWEVKGIKPVTISSNFSKLNLANPNFAETILSIMTKYSVSPDLLEVELTESSGYTDYDALILFVEKMNKAKIHTSIDDFGTGYSSLSMLKDINVDVVKIDKSFLAKTNSDDLHQEKMLNNVIQMINDLDRTVICEGIENASQLEFLKNASCTVVQGFIFDKPLPHDEFEKRLISPHYDENFRSTALDLKTEDKSEDDDGEDILTDTADDITVPDEPETDDAKDEPEDAAPETSEEPEDTDEPEDTEKDELSDEPEDNTPEVRKPNRNKKHSRKK